MYVLIMITVAIQLKFKILIKSYHKQRDLRHCYTNVKNVHNLHIGLVYSIPKMLLIAYCYNFYVLLIEIDSEVHSFIIPKLITLGMTFYF